MKIAPVVLAGGRPGPFEKLTGPLPKTYVRVGGRRLYQYAADPLAATFGRVYVVTPHPERGPYIYVEEKGQGIEQAIAAAESHLGAETHILLAYGDVYVDPAAFRTLVESAISAGADGAILAVPRKTTKGYGAVETKPGGLLAKIGGESQWIYAGAALLPRDVAKAAAQAGFYEALNEAAKNKKIAVAPWGGVWHDVNYPEDLLPLLEHVAPRHTYIAEGARVSPTAVLQGPVVVEEQAEVDHYAVVKGPAYIGKRAFVGSHSLVRNYAYIEEEAVVGSAAEISHSLIGQRATVGRASFISYSVVGEEAVVEPNAITMSVLREGRERLEPVEVRGARYYKLGALIPRGARIPAAAVLKPGTGWQ
ncbi:NTP transferase domain-containing protein [Pyrobaculum neutrophilum]|uniref:Nucleotidyl transferase n=1 Tax=Pyrobaculum neutrophilum (strain DSM 2338 / JCM 9278 / NBRC 100436 / V24Sta) TaxID=444157 RepID=B1YAG7_PYRNV|nr:NDP-sugar synthase [Pyrobaculum neutrophilum]ACB40616.1 nucleotidyl transferase [Pyrobaculum neutrophilum V24Sta]